jgi:hypothetical protein
VVSSTNRLTAIDRAVLRPPAEILKFRFKGDMTVFFYFTEVLYRSDYVTGADRGGQPRKR